MGLIDSIRNAYPRIAPHLRKTPLEYSPYFSRRSGAEVYLKLENLQVTGSFKPRGALAKLTSLGAAEAQRGVVTASSGNHGAAVAYGMRRLGITGEIYVPENVSPAKLENIRAHLGDAPGQILFHGLDSGHTEIFARKRAVESGRTYVSPYNDDEIIAGQGTIAIEIEESMGRAPDALMASVGGGGLIAGIAGYFREKGAPLVAVASSPERSHAMKTSLDTGRVVSVTSHPTLSDGTAGDVEEGCVTFDLCRKWLDDFVLIEEEDISAAMRSIIEHHHMLVEGAAGVALASLDKVREKIAKKTVVVVLCGANLSLETLKGVLSD